MTTIKVNFGAMAAGHEGLQATWQRIETHLADLDTAVAATGDMEAEALASYKLLKAQWDASAADRQIALQSLTQCVEQAAETYRQADAAAAAQFAF